MNLDYTEVQEELRKVVREFMKRNYPSSRVREMEDDEKGFDADLWKQAANMGWIGWTIPQQYGGLGGELMDLVVILEEMGRACFFSPFLSTVLCASSLIDAGSEDQKSKYLPSVALGDLIMSLAWAEPGADYDINGIVTKAANVKDGFSLSGTKFFVPHARAAKGFLVIARTGYTPSIEDSLSLFMVDASSHGIEITPLQTISQDKQDEVIFNDTSISSGDLIGGLNRGYSAIKLLQEKAMVLKCAEMLGAADHVLEDCTSYAKERVQYGKPIGSYGIIQHYLADMWTEINMARRFLYYAAWKLEKGIPCSQEASMVKVLFSEGYKRWTRTGVQILGAIGTSREHDMGLYYRRAREAALLYGSPAWNKNRVAMGMFPGSSYYGEQ